jgi:hypothetical protein
MRLKSKSLLLIFTLAVFLCGCNKSQFQKTYDSFKNLYIEANSFKSEVNMYTIVDFVKAIDLEKYENDYKTLVEEQKNMEKIASSKEEKYFCDTARSSLEDMESVLSARKKIDNLTIDEQGKLSASVALVSGNVDDYSSSVE